MVTRVTGKEQLLPALGAGIEVLPAPLRQVSVYTVPDKISQAGYALDAAVKLLDFYEDYFSIPYPLPKQGKCYLLTALEIVISCRENSTGSVTQSIQTGLTDFEPGYFAELKVRSESSTVDCLLHSAFFKVYVCNYPLQENPQRHVGYVCLCGSSHDMR